MNKKILVIIGIAFLLVASCAGAIVVGVMGMTQPVADTAEKFMVALRDEQYQEAFDIGSPSFQREASNPAGLERIVKGGNVHPTAWSFSSRNISGDTGQVEGSATFVGGRTGTVSVMLAKVGNEWKVTGFNLREH